MERLTAAQVCFRLDNFNGVLVKTPYTDLNQAEDICPARFFAPSGPAIADSCRLPISRGLWSVELETKKDRLAACASHICLPHGCFPVHEIIERSSSFVLNKFDDVCIIDEAEKWGPVRNQIKWVDQIL
jgi:hypothetical protein